MKHVLLVTDGIVHPPLAGRMTLHRVLRGLEGYAFRHVRSLERLPDDLGSVAALVLHFHHRVISEKTLGRLDDFVRGGGGILALHAATASFKQSPSYFEILGGRFTGHGAVEPIRFIPKREDLFGGVGAFTLRDELYLHELQPGLAVHFAASKDGREIPLVWTHRYGAGRVCYAAPGHTAAGMRHPALQEILRRGLRWAAE